MLTDYLEALLELEQERQEENGLDWPARPMAAWVGAQWDKLGDAGSRSLQSQVEREKVYTWTEAETQRREQSVVWLTERLKQLRGTVERAKERRRSGMTAEAAYGHGAAQLLMGTKPTLRSAVDYAALVDTAFQRDARRYDGQLGLL